MSLSKIYFVVLLAVMRQAAIGQTDAGALRVLVLDQSSVVVQGADAKISNPATNLVITKKSNEEGYAIFDPLTRGDYQVEVSAAGFRTARVEGIAVNVAERRLIRVILTVSAVEQSIEVSTAMLAPLQSEEGSLGQVISGKIAVELPLAARRYSELALLVPGAAPSRLDVTVRGPGWFVVNGNFHTQNNFLLDGFDNNQGTGNMQSLSAQVVQPSPDSLSEFKVQTNSFSAEFGRSAGAVINASIKSGTNDLHGSGWYYNRNAVLAANSWRNNLIGAPREDLRWHQFGATVGGPVKRDKLFYFGDYEGFRLDRTDTHLVAIPTADQRNGRFAFDVRDPLDNRPFPNRTIPQTRWDNLGKKLIDLYPAPTGPGRTVAGGRVVENYGVARPQVENTHKFNIRSDAYATGKDRLFVRYSFLEQDINREPILPLPADDAGRAGQQFNRNHSLGVTWSRVISSSLVNELRIGHNRTFAEFAHAGKGTGTGTQFGFRNIPKELDEVGGLPRIGVTNYQSMGTATFRPQFQRPHVMQFNNVLSWVQRAHTVKAGFDFRRRNNQYVDIQNRTADYSFTGEFTGDGIADLLIGNVQALRVNNFVLADELQEAWSLFLQDDWKVTPNLTLNLGVRYEYTTPSWLREPFTASNLNLQTGEIFRFAKEDLRDPKSGLLIRGSDNKFTVNPDRNNIGPRLGAAWQLIPERLVLRGGFGIFFHGENPFNDRKYRNVPNLYLITLQRVGLGAPPLLLSDPLPNNILDRVDPSSLSLFAQNQDMPMPLVRQWNVSMQYSLPSSSSFELAYAGNRGNNLFGSWSANQTNFGVDGTVVANRPFPQYQSITLYENAAWSNYNALQAKFEKRSSGGLYMLASYTFASAIDEVGTGFAAGSSPVFKNDWRSERAFSGQTPRHRFSNAWVAPLPFGRGRKYGASMSPLLDAALGGWQISGILSAQTGQAVNVSLAATGVDPRTGAAYRLIPRNGGGFRPDRLGQANTGIDPKVDRFRYLDAAAYSVPSPLNARGNAGRNTAWGPGLFNIDTSLVKQFPIGERVKLDFRAEAFNLFNKTNFIDPDGNFGSTGFGIISNANPPRIIQLALRFAF